MGLSDWLRIAFGGRMDSPEKGYHERDFFWQGEGLNVSYDEEQPCWLVMVSAPFGVMVHRVFDQEPDSAALWDLVVEALQLPQVGDFRRPTILRVKANQGWESLEPRLQQRGIELEVCSELALVDGWIETIDCAFVEWDKRRTKWKVVRRDDNGHTITVETGLSRKEAELSVMISQGANEKHAHWIERDDACDGRRPNRTVALDWAGITVFSRHHVPCSRPGK